MIIHPSALIAVIVAVLAVAGVIILIRTPKEKRKTDYRAYYDMGIVWFPVGIVFWIVLDNIAFLALGLIFLSIGLANRDKWEKQVEIKETEKTKKSKKKKK